jgi:hypothetical protein
MVSILGFGNNKSWADNPPMNQERKRLGCGWSLGLLLLIATRQPSTRKSVALIATIPTRFHEIEDELLELLLLVVAELGEVELDVVRLVEMELDEEVEEEVVEDNVEALDAVVASEMTDTVLLSPLATKTSPLAES